MPTTFDFGFRDALLHFHGGARLHVLVALMLRANVRNRCWPSMRRIAKDTGYALAAVNEAKKWLEEHGAIEVVKYDQRIGDEKTEINHLQNVYQLTGVFKIDGVTYPYLYVGVPQIETSRIETSRIETEVVKDSKSIKKKRKESAASDEARARTAQSAVESSSVEAPAEPTPEQPAKEARARTPRQIESVAAAEALAAAMGVTLASSDYGLYKKHAALLVAGGVTASEFNLYVKRVRHQADGKWTVTVTSLTGNGRISEYITARDAHRAKQQAGEAQGVWSGETLSAHYHQPAVIVPEAQTINADVLNVFQEISHADPK